MNYKTNLHQVTKMPSLMVMIGLGDSPYRRNDGVYVVPIGCLRA